MFGTIFGLVIMLISMGDMKNIDVETQRPDLQRMIGVGPVRITHNLAKALTTDMRPTLVQLTTLGWTGRSELVALTRSDLPVTAAA